MFIKASMIILDMGGAQTARLGLNYVSIFVLNYKFYRVTGDFIPQIKQARGISGILSNHYAWHSKPYTDKDGNT